mmetsp:Transcript_25407/g.58974  ORF Transcript_25407/g.58974 Transcript_25407/m.58974 type:complete len:295 (+) Transcript_25407:194-1078(+)
MPVLGTALSSAQQETVTACGTVSPCAASARGRPSCRSSFDCFASSRSARWRMRTTVDATVSTSGGPVSCFHSSSSTCLGILRAASGKLKAPPLAPPVEGTGSKKAPLSNATFASSATPGPPSRQMYASPILPKTFRRSAASRPAIRSSPARKPLEWPRKTRFTMLVKPRSCRPLAMTSCTPGIPPVRTTALVSRSSAASLRASAWHSGSVASFQKAVLPKMQRRGPGGSCSLTDLARTAISASSHSRVRGRRSFDGSSLFCLVVFPWLASLRPARPKSVDGCEASAAPSQVPLA